MVWTFFSTLGTIFSLTWTPSFLDWTTSFSLASLFKITLSPLDKVTLALGVTKSSLVTLLSTCFIGLTKLPVKFGVFKIILPKSTPPETRKTVKKKVLTIKKEKIDLMYQNYQIIKKQNHQILII